MKVGILTLQLHENYGGLLQAYALQTAIQLLGHDVEVISHGSLRPGRIRKLISKCVPGFFPVRRSNGKFCTLSTRRKLTLSASTDLQQFVDEYINLSDSEYTVYDLHKLNNAGYDALVVGSDQVWRPNYAGRVQSYFFDFIQNERIIKLAYAASFGISRWEFSEEEAGDCRRHLASFKAVSVRESIAVDWVREKFGCKAELVLDPTLLLGAEHYKQFVEDYGHSKSACTYLIAPSIQMNKLIDDTLHGLELTRVSPMPSVPKDQIEEDSMRKYPSMSYWISAFYNAEIVITDSFHGTVFAIMFNKPFITINNSRLGSPRFESLLGELGLLSRLVDRVECVSQALESASEIDWLAVNAKLSVWRERSIEFLRSNLS